MKNMTFRQFEKIVQENTILLADSRFGRYMMPLFIQANINNPNWNFTNVHQQDIDIVKNENFEHEFYCEAIHNIVDKAYLLVQNTKGKTEIYRIVYNEDLWAVSEQMNDEFYENWLI